ncbi:MAG: MFS transporter [Minwuia sp.]|uniref:MFS transporter n=1 Tax=Minwuia sp. TaxID=2493630 RepID=UPI003A860C4F
MTFTATREDGPLYPSAKRPFHGWIMVWAAFLVMMVGFGVAYSFSAFFDALATEFGGDRGATSRIFGIAGFLYFFLGAWSGPAGDRIGAAPVTIFGSIFTAAGLFLAARAGTLEQVYWAYGIGVGIGVGCMYVPAVGVVQRWFAVKRATASGVAIMGIGVGTFIAPHAGAFLIDLGGWRLAYDVMAVAVLVIGGGAGLLLRNSPESRGQFPDGADGPPQGANSGPSLTRGEAARTLPFWMILTGALLVSIGLFVPFVHIAKFAEDVGLNEAQGFWVISAIGIGSILGRIALGPVAQRVGRQPVTTALYIGIALSLAGWNFSTMFWQLLLFGVVFGTLYGGFVALAPTLLSDYFGVGHVGSVIGVVYASVGVGALIGPAVAGDLYDLYRSYEFPILIGSGLCLIAAVCVMLPSSPVDWRNRRFGTQHR